MPCVPSAVHRAHAILAAAAAAAHTAARSAGCRNLRCRLRHPRHRHVSRRSGRAHSCSCSHALAVAAMSRQVHLASVLQRRVPQPLQPASVLQRRVPQPLHLATVPRRRVPQLLQPQLRCHVGACLSRSNLLSVPRRRVPQPLRSIWLRCLVGACLSCSNHSYGATSARASADPTSFRCLDGACLSCSNQLRCHDGACLSVAAVAKLRIGLLRASVARNVQYCCYVACMIVLERS
jgi:hypothetical protein